jgi:hypothetical protein
MPHLVGLGLPVRISISIRLIALLAPLAVFWGDAFFVGNLKKVPHTPQIF